MAPSSMQRRGARLAPLPCATARSCLFSLVFGTERPPFGAYPDKAEQIRRTSAVFANDGWEVPRLLNALRRAAPVDGNTFPFEEVYVMISR